ncbi:MAG: glycerate kinase family protein [Gemmatimonadota bacterium]
MTATKDRTTPHLTARFPIVTSRRAPRVVVAPNAFKGTFDAIGVARAWGEALADVARVDLRPMSDGGDGFVAVVRHYRPETLEVRARVPDPLGRPIDAAWGWEPDRHVAYLESAAAIGLRHLAPEERRPLVADSAGLGRLIEVTGSLSVRRLLIGLGGSATVDGGLGMARALGYRFLDARGRPICRPGDLPRLARLAPPKDAPALPTGVTALADVESPLLGPRGAAAVFGPQKGASPADVERLEAGLARLAERWSADLGVPSDLVAVRGAGAAGGLGAGLVAFLGARLAGGTGWYARLAGLARALDKADLVLTGEGRLDAQSLAGKGTGYVLSRARRRNLPVGIVCAEAAVPGSCLGPSVTLVEGRADALSLDDLGRLARLAFDRLREARV